MFVFNITVLPRLVVGLLVFIVGKDGLPVGGVRPVTVERDAVASCPMSFCPLNKVIAPVYCVKLS